MQSLSYNPSRTLRLALVLAVACLGAPLARAWASPFEEVRSDNDLYRRVKALEKWGLLDAADQAVLDKGETVTRLQLAYYTEKAKTRLSAPLFPTPTPVTASAPTVVEPAPVAPAPAAPAPASPAPMPDLVAPAPVAEQPPTEPELDALSRNIQGPEARTQLQSQSVSPSDPLFQKVSGFRKWSLLEPRDQAALDSGAPVTRLQLLETVERVKARMFPSAAAVAVQPVLVAPTPAPYVPPAVASEIDALLKALKEESVYLRGRLKLLDSDLADREKELAALKKVQLDAEGVVRKANKNSGDWSFNTNTRFKFEDFTLKGDNSKPVTGTPMAAQRITKMGQEIYFGMWGSLGKGSLSTGIGGTFPSSNDDSWPVSLYLGRPEFKITLDGKAGTWNLFAMDEGFHSETTMGDFTRGVASDRPKQYERPFDVKPFSDDKFDKNWDDYIRSLGFVETQSLLGGVGQSTSDRVFDGIVADGGDLPLVGPETKVKLLAGRMLKPSMFEYGARIVRPWGKNRVTTTLGGLWVDDMTPRTYTSPSIDLHNYTAELSLDCRPLPLALSAEGAISRLYTGYDALAAPGQAKPLIGQALQVQASSYPFNFYYQDIRPEYSNFQSKVDMAGIHFDRYGISAKDLDQISDKFGEVGEANILQSNRVGWRANFGWNGRRNDWMKKDLPSFMDYFVLNVDVASRAEHEAANNSYLGNSSYFIEPWTLVAPYYADDEGLWGLDLNGGYGGSPKPVRATYDTNIYTVRSAQDPLAQGATPSRTWNSSYEWVRYRFTMASERIPLLDPKTGADLSHLKTFHYVAITNKWQLNQLYGGAKPLYLGIYIANNQVSGKAQTPGQTDIADIFTQTVEDFTLMAARILPYTQFSLHYANEKWKSQWSIPLIDYNTDSYGAGIDYNIPWGGSKLGLRYNHVVFKSQYVPANNYIAEQVYCLAVFHF